jgi:glycosyltransferase involved in cell wall biosynthesis
MRILVVATDIVLPGRHGGSTHVRELVDHLGHHGQTLLLASRGSSGPGIAPVGRPMRRFPAALRHTDALRTFLDAGKAVDEFRPDVIYERCTSYGVGAMLSRERGIPLLSMVLDRRYSWLSLMQASRIVATDPAAVVPASVRHKAVKVSWGANEGRFHPGVDGRPARERYGLGDAFVVGYAGTFRPWHGVDVLIRALQRLRDTNVRVLLVGDGPGRADIEALVDQVGVRDRVVFTGAVDYGEVPEVLAASDITVAPFEPRFHKGSRGGTGFVLDPLKVFEYLALGKPTITVREPNIEALFEHEEDLLLVTPGSESELADAIVRLEQEREFAVATAERGRAKVLAKHTWGAHAQQLAGLFSEMLEQR